MSDLMFTKLDHLVYNIERLYKKYPPKWIGTLECYGEWQFLPASKEDYDAEELGSILHKMKELNGEENTTE
jgi:hypothetical protein